MLDRPMPVRLTRAALALGAMWLVAIACVFVPVGHFVLVPAFFGAGLVLGFVRLRDDVSLVASDGICPRCRVPRTFGASGRFRGGASVHCDGCGCQLAVQPTD